MKINKRTSLQQFLPQIQGLLQPAEANLGYFLVWFSLSSCPQRSLKVLLHLTPTCLEVCTQL
jgi:hypothetical protein